MSLKDEQFDELLEWISAHCYDYGHGLLPGSEFVVDARPLLRQMARLAGWTDEQMTEGFDLARFNARWKALAKEGQCDAFGGAEYARILREWLATDRVGMITPFIITRANIGSRG